MKIYIGVPTADSTRHAVFYDYLAGLVKPDDTVGASFHTNSAAYNRNMIIDDALAAEATHILFIDDDMAFAPDSLLRLIQHDKDLVSGLYLSRNYPHLPTIFDNYEVPLKRRFLESGQFGLIEVGACGFGFLLIKTHIFEHLSKPYVMAGEVYADRRNEDLGFCRRVKEAGFKIYCDLNTTIGHMGMVTFWPTVGDNNWFTGIDTGGTEIFSVPQETSKIEIKTPLDRKDFHSHLSSLIDR